MANNFEISSPKVINDGLEATAIVRSNEDGWVGEARWDEVPVGRVQVRGPLMVDLEGLDGGGEVYGGGEVVEAREGVAVVDREATIQELASLAYDRYFAETSEERE